MIYNLVTLQGPHERVSCLASQTLLQMKVMGMKTKYPGEKVLIGDECLAVEAIDQKNVKQLLVHTQLFNQMLQLFNNHSCFYIGFVQVILYAAAVKAGLYDSQQRYFSEVQPSKG